MSLVPLADLLAAARAGGYAVGYFEAWGPYSLEAVAEAAEAERAPVILGFGCAMVDRNWLDAGGIDLWAGLGRHVAERVTVPVSLLLNETHTLDQARRGIEQGFTAAMPDTGALPATRSRQMVEEFVRWAHARGAWVEAELGQLPGVADGHIDRSHATMTDPEEAAAYVAATGVDCLAVSVGNVHLLEETEAALDLDRLAAIGQAAGVPLALHGGTSLPRHALPGAISAGVAKINVGTGLKRAFRDGAREALALDLSPHDLLGSHKPSDAGVAGKERMIAVVRDRMGVYGCAGRAN